MGAVIGLSSTRTQCQAGRHEEVNYALSTFDNTEMKGKKGDKACRERFNFRFELGGFRDSEPRG